MTNGPTTTVCIDMITPPPPSFSSLYWSSNVHPPTHLRRSARSPLRTWSCASSFLPRALRVSPFIANVSPWVGNFLSTASAALRPFLYSFRSYSFCRVHQAAGSHQSTAASHAWAGGGRGVSYCFSRPIRQRYAMHHIRVVGGEQALGTGGAHLVFLVGPAARVLVCGLIVNGGTPKF